MLLIGNLDLRTSQLDQVDGSGPELHYSAYGEFFPIE